MQQRQANKEMFPVLRLVTRRLRLGQEMTSYLLTDIRDCDKFLNYNEEQSGKRGPVS